MQPTGRELRASYQMIPAAAENEQNNWSTAEKVNLFFGVTLVIGLLCLATGGTLLHYDITAGDKVLESGCYISVISLIALFISSRAAG